MDTTLNERLPQVRCSTELKKRLWLVSQRSAAKDLADHIRAAVEQYVEREEKRMVLPKDVEPVTVN